MGKLVATVGPVSLCVHWFGACLLKTRALSIALGVERSRFHQVVAVCALGFSYLVFGLMERTAAHTHRRRCGYRGK